MYMYAKRTNTKLPYFCLNLHNYRLSNNFTLHEVLDNGTKL